jgi:hypothetical protein
MCGQNLVNNLSGYGVMLLEAVVVDCLSRRSFRFSYIIEAVSYFVFQSSHPGSYFGGAINVRAQHA